MHAALSSDSRSWRTCSAWTDPTEKVSNTLKNEIVRNTGFRNCLAINAPPKSRLLHQRRRHCLEFDPAHLRLPGEHADVLGERALEDGLAQSFCDLGAHRLERHPPSRRSPVDGNDVKPVAGPDELPVNARPGT